MELHGVIVLDKPAGWTSHDAVNKIRRLTGQSKVGHLGTLDPMATGVLPLVVGKATRLAQFVALGRKVYETVVRFGFATDSYDREGEPTTPSTPFKVSAPQLEEWLERFRGAQQQMPPPISAKKINGVPAYKLARKKLPFTLKAVEVIIDELELLHCDGACAQLRIVCSPGTYIRSIAHDLGQLAGCGAHLVELRRLESCGFGLGDVRTMEALIGLAAEQRLAEVVVPSACLLPEFPSVRVDPDTVSHIRQGRTFRMSPFRDSSDAPRVKAVAEDGELIAIGEARMPLVYQPIVVF